MPATAIRDGALASLLIVGLQAAYRLYPRYFAALALGAVVTLLFYRKLDRIEAALSEARRREQFKRERVRGRSILVTIIVAGILAGVGSYALWNWVLPAG